MPDWVKYGVFWHVYPLGFCGADIGLRVKKCVRNRGFSRIDL